MKAIQRTRNAILSAIKGWLFAWFLLIVLWGLNSWRAGVRQPLTDWLSILIIWMTATGLVTMATTILLVVPYVCLRNADTLRRQPWRIYAESGFLAIIAALVVSHATKPYARLFWSYAWPLLLIALLISLASSAFYMRRLKAESDDAIAEL